MATPTNNSVRKAFEILVTFMENRHDLTARQVADLTGMNAATAHRFLITLESVGAITRSDDNRYQLGTLIAELGSKVKRHRILDDAIKPLIDDLVTATRESVQVGVLSGSRVLQLRASQSDRMLQPASAAGNLLPVHSTAMGKVLLSGMPEADRAAFLEDVALTRYTSHTIVEEAAFLHELALTVDRGYAISEGEYEDGLSSVAVPVLDNKSRVMAALAISGPTARMTDEAIAAHLKVMRHGAAQIQRKLYSSSVVVAGMAPPRGSFPHVKRTGDFIFVSGISSRKPDGTFEGVRTTSAGKVQFDFRRQAAETLHNIIDVLAEAGAEADDVAEMTVYLTRDQDYELFNEVYSEYFGVEGPARSTVVVKRLPHEHQLIMIRAIAFKPLI